MDSQGVACAGGRENIPEVLLESGARDWRWLNVAQQFRV